MSVEAREAEGGVFDEHLGRVPGDEGEDVQLLLPVMGLQHKHLLANLKANDAKRDLSKS